MARKEVTEVEGWYDLRGSFHEGSPGSRFKRGPDEWDDRRIVIDFGKSAGKDRYKTIWPSEWDWDDWDAFLDDVEDWFDTEYGEATQ